MTRYFFSPAADADLVEIWLYTAETWSADQADTYTGRIVEACSGIAAGRTRGKPADRVKRDYLKVAVGSHFIVYRQTEDQIVVVRILHQRMDISSHLRD